MWVNLRKSKEIENEWVVLKTKKVRNERKGGVWKKREEERKRKRYIYKRERGRETIWLDNRRES